MRQGVRLKYIKIMRPRSGGPAYPYYAKPGHKLVRLPDLPENHPDFLRACSKAAEGAPKVRGTPRAARGQHRRSGGVLQALRRFPRPSPLHP